jgi:hypothetical protein
MLTGSISESRPPCPGIRTLALCEVKRGKRGKRRKPWHQEKGLMAFLQAL